MDSPLGVVSRYQHITFEFSFNRSLLFLILKGTILKSRNPFYYNAKHMLACKICSNSFIASLEQEAKQSDAIR